MSSLPVVINVLHIQEGQPVGEPSTPLSNMVCNDTLLFCSRGRSLGGQQTKPIQVGILVLCKSLVRSLLFDLVLEFSGWTFYLIFLFADIQIVKLYLGWTVRL